MADGLRPFDLTAPDLSLYPAYSPFRETAADRLEIQARAAERLKQLVERLNVAVDTWKAAMEGSDHPYLRAAIALHEPYSSCGDIDCKECASFDREGMGATGWPCDTYRALTGVTA